MSLILDGTNGLSDVDGTAAAPAIRGTDTNTGIFFGADIIGFSEGGVESARFNADAQFVAAAGTAALPVITTTGDVNTGVFFPAADTVAVSTGGTERARIDSSGTLSVTGSGQIDGNLGVGVRNRITSTNRISVAGATTIFSMGLSGSSVGASSAVLLVNGYNTASSTNSFTDLVLFIGGVTPVVVSSVNRGSPAARTYTASGNSLQLAMASGTYNVANSSTEQAN